MSNIIEDIYRQIKINKEKELAYINISYNFLNPQTIGNCNKECIERYSIPSVNSSYFTYFNIK